MGGIWSEYVGQTCVGSRTGIAEGLGVRLQHGRPCPPRALTCPCRAAPHQVLPTASLSPKALYEPSLCL